MYFCVFFAVNDTGLNLCLLCTFISIFDDGHQCHFQTRSETLGALYHEIRAEVERTSGRFPKPMFGIAYDTDKLYECVCPLVIVLLQV